MAKPVSVAQFIGRETNSHRHKYDRLLPKIDGMYGSYRDAMLSKIPATDHAFQCGPFMVSRPYGLSTDALKKLVEFAEEFDFEVSVGGVTSWHPATIMVQIVRPEWVRAFFVRAERYGDAFRSSVSEAVYYRIHGAMHRVHKYRGGREYETGIWVLNNTISKHGVGGGDGLKVTEVLVPEPAFNIDPDTYP